VINVISLGAGVQSSAMALMAARGLITPMPDCAIFADTKDEGQDTYEHLRWLCTMLPFPILNRTKGQLSEQLFAGNEGARIPAFVEGSGMSKRQCTRTFKIRPIRQAVREALGVGRRSYIPASSVSQWIGISCDEADRMKPSGVKFIVNRWPLIERNMSRFSCELFLKEAFNLTVPKSSCVYCAFQSDAQWLDRKENHPEDFAKACAVDERLRSPENVSRFHGRLFLHRSAQPLSQIDFASRKHLRGTGQGDLFSAECEGVCGV